VDSSGSGNGQIAGVFERGSEYTPPPPQKKMRSFVTDSDVVRFSKRILLHGVCLFGYLFVTGVMWCSAYKVSVRRTCIFDLLLVFWTHKCFGFH
jgi:hypothetical protein